MCHGASQQINVTGSVHLNEVLDALLEIVQSADWATALYESLPEPLVVAAACGHQLGIARIVTMIESLIACD